MSLTNEELRSLGEKLHTALYEVNQRIAEIQKISHLLISASAEKRVDELKDFINTSTRPQKKYLLTMKDLTGREEPAMLTFDTELDRDSHVVMCLSDDGADDDEVQEYLNSLEGHQSIEHENTEYQFITA